MLATLDSAELAAAQRNFLKAGLDLELVQRAVERARLLVNADDRLGPRERPGPQHWELHAKIRRPSEKGDDILLYRRKRP
jgi:hypothetical protein